MGINWEEIKHAFQKLFGREMTADEAKYLSLADQAIPLDEQPADEKSA